jgi:hypothetical protein
VYELFIFGFVNSGLSLVVKNSIKNSRVLLERIPFFQDNNPDGCTECFCFGKTTFCSSQGNLAKSMVRLTKTSDVTG